MEVKKSAKADLEKKKGLFFEIGLLFALALVLNAFEWKTSDDFVAEEADEIVFIEEEDVIPVTWHQNTPPPPPPAPSLTDFIQIIENEIEVDEDLEIVDVEDPSDNSQILLPGDGEDWGGDPGEPDVPFILVEDMPVFPGGDINAWLNKNVDYPYAAQENRIQGKVTARFVVGRSGDVEDIEVLRGADPMLDKEAIRVIDSMPRWTPGKQRGQNVRVAYTVQINFRLQ